MSRKPFTIGNYYHVFNRGNNKQKIFQDDRDNARFLFSILYYGLTHKILPKSENITNYLYNGKFDVELDIEQLEEKTVNLHGFALMPNHFHLLLREATKNGISKYMQRLQNSYTKYYNARHKTAGHLLQGPYKVVSITNELQLLYLTAYIHRNPAEILDWNGNEHAYPWSSFQDYITKNRWEKILNTKILNSTFQTPQEYLEFVRQSGAKSTLDVESTS
ncbi:MAG: hypothetical protein CMI52_04550, partial [Parcubacteria group bacterium]|nr:hypothetical protein [Parcubacteria group bacterium]